MSDLKKRKTSAVPELADRASSKKLRDTDQKPAEASAEPVQFYSTRKDQRFGRLSNFDPSPITIKGRMYRNSESFFQSAKFALSDPAYARQVAEAKDNRTAKRMGGSRKHPIDSKWDQGRNLECMHTALHHKFSQWPDLKALLLSTGDRRLEEAAPRDGYWGTGSSAGGRHVGLNHLGSELGLVRKSLRDDVAPEACQRCQTYLALLP